MKKNIYVIILARYCQTSLWLLCCVCVLSSLQCQKTEIIKTVKPKEELGVVLPQIEILTNGSVPISSKETYIQATLPIKGQNKYKDYKGSVQIRGRGNTTWYFPKKPYRLKLDTKDSLLGLAADKDWILLANYLDGTHSLNAVAMQAGKLLNMPFTNTIIPVEVKINGQYQGCYMFTEQIEVEKDRIDIGNKGVLLLFDRNYDEAWKFKSGHFQLPIMVKYPELANDAEISPIKTQFEQFEALVARPDFPNNNYLDYFDAEAFVNYLIVYMLTDNEEINHPKSLYVYKKEKGKYTMGPIWDFDWAFAYEKSLVHFSTNDRPLFWSAPSEGTRFFSKILTDPAIKSILKQKWADFNKNKLPELLLFVDNYTQMIENARNRDYQIWKRGNIDFKSDVKKLKAWLQNRAVYMDSYLKNL